ncbi:MAG TPA: hypothetical protein VNY73_02910 [Bacteroidia bacterium]|jgi:hypothetical protein|nr:hypothetical protein [Bacteroidia bacterium]
MRRIFGIIFLVLGGVNAFAQCCTSGCCAPGTANFGVLEKGDLMVFSFFKRNYSDKYFEGDKPVNFNYLTNDFSDYSGISLSYGITSKLTVQGSLGYFINKTENFNVPVLGQQQLTGSGLADAELYAKYNVFQSKNDVLSITLSAGAKMPTGPYNLKVNDVQLTRDVQPGTGAYAGVFTFYAMLKPFKNKQQSIMFNSRTDYNGVNPQGYRYGTSNTNTISTAIKLYKEISVIVMVRNENHDCDKVNGVNLFSSCSARLFFAPGISINMGHDLSFSAYGDLPIYQYYSGIQLASRYAYSFALVKVFEVHKKEIPGDQP